MARPAAPWRWALASVIGTSHERTGAPCQDHSACEAIATVGGAPLLVGVVADGAGSASRAQEGSRLACDVVVSELRTLAECGDGVAAIDRAFAEGLVTRFQAEVARRAQADGLTPRDYACTLLAAFVSADAAAYMQIGDGAIVVSRWDDPEFGWIFWPQQGEYANATHFATDADACERLAFETSLGPIDELAMFSDGIQGLVLHYATRSVHSPFFERMLAPLRKTVGDGHAAALSEALARYLASKEINARTDDDRTLVLATRRLARSAAGTEP